MLKNLTEKIKKFDFNHFKKPIKIVLPFLIFLFFLKFASGTFFSSEKAKTELLIQELKKINKLEVLESSLFAHKVYADDSFLGLNNNEFVIIAKGKAIYGVDLSKETKIDLQGKNIVVTLPKTEIFNVILNPEDIEVIAVKKGFFTSQNRFEQIKKENLVELQNEIKSKSNDREVIAKARENAENIITSFFKAMGYEQVTIKYNGFEKIGM